MKQQEKRFRKNIWNCLKAYFSVYAFSTQVVLAVLIGLIVFVLDCYNVPSYVFMNIPRGLLGVIICASCILLVVWLIQFHVHDLFYIASENPLDEISFIIIIASLFYILARCHVLGFCLYVWIAIAIFIVFILLFGVRLVLRFRTQEKNKGYVSNLIDLKALYENGFIKIDNEPILLSECDVDYDLLDRDGIIDKLYYSIKYCRPEESYVISLEGEWGTGKTTIINNTKRLLIDKENNEKEYIIIDDFDPWLYGTENALLLAMFESIISHTGLKYSPIKSHILMKKLSKTVSDNHAVGGILSDLFYGTRKQGDDISKLKKQIRNYLYCQDKAIVFFIDNLDRANDTNIIFLFKLIGIVFDLPGIIYVLSFERERINSILEKTHDFDSRFSEKIIQQEIKVPTISAERAEQLYFTCIENLLISYGVPKDDVINFVDIAKYIASETNNVRSFKRMINSVFSAVFSDNNYLDKHDLLALEVIHFYDPLLYTSIYRNSQYYISYERNPVDTFHMSWNKEEYNKNAKEYFDNIFDSKENAKELLAEVFPYVNKYNKNQPLEQETSFPDSNMGDVVKRGRVCNAKYFDLYFSYSSNNSLMVRKSVESYISNINSSSGLESVQKLTRVVFYTTASEYHKEWIERLQYYISDIKEGIIYYVIISLYTMIYDINEEKTHLGYGLGARVRAEYIISELLLKCSEKEFDDFLLEISANYDKLGVIYSIIKWLSNDTHDNSATRKNRAKKFYLCYSEICERVIDKKINLYSDKYYNAENTWGIYHYFKEKDAINVFTSFIRSILSSENIYRVLWDIKTCAIGNNYLYSLNEENLSIFLGDIEIVKSLIENNPPKSKDEEFIYQMYDIYCNGQPDEWGHKGVVTETAVNLNL